MLLATSSKYYYHESMFLSTGGVHICNVLPDSLAVAPILPVFHHAPRFVRAVARDTGAAVLVHFAGRGVIGCPDGLTAVTCELALRIIIIIWDDALADAAVTHAVGGAERL